MKEQFFCIGQIVRPRGLKGTCKVQLLTDIFAHFQELDYVFLDKKEQVAIESSQFESNFAYFKFEGIDDIDAAEKLRGKKVYIPHDSIKIPEGRYFISDLIDVDVFVGSRLLGTLVDVLQYGSADVYIVKTENKGNVSFPALKKLIMNIDINANKMLLDEKVFVEVAVYPDNLK
ncbi:MAG: ribosome maturation factor RimM [Clostridia bacterium]|nr:ribosome maturation factor RimM [Clostridia bacterium]